LDLTTSAGQRELSVLLALAPQLDAIITQREQEREALLSAQVQVQGYINLLTGEVPSTLQQIGSEIGRITSALSSTTDVQQRLALESQLGDLIFQRYEQEILMLGSVIQAIEEMYTSITAERTQVTEARAQISGAAPIVMSAAEIRAGVSRAGQLGMLPSDQAISSAANQVANFNAEIDRQSSLLTHLAGQASQRNAALQTELSLSQRAVDLFNANRQVGSAFATGAGGGLASAAFDSKTGMNRTDYARITYNVGDEASVVALRSQINTVLRDALNGTTIADALFGANTRVANARTQLSAVESQIVQTQSTITALKDQLKAAELDRIAAQQTYISQIQEFVADAGLAVTKLSRLREETVKFYEQQAQLATLMRTQADALRGTVAQIRFADLNPLQQLQNLQEQFGVAFASASVSSGQALSGFGNDINALIGPILQTAADVYASGPEFQRIKELVLSQAETVANRLDELSPQNYQQESLAILDTIDTTLDLIEQNTKSAERLIVEAIDRSKDATLSGLRGVIAAINGESIPAFRSGGDHIGGIRRVGEAGQELEVSGPSRIYSNRQLGNMILGAPGQTEVVEELKALRQEVRVGGQLNLKVVTSDGRTIMDKTMKELQERSRKGELVVYADGVK
jgi:hypothetical protein